MNGELSHLTLAALHDALNPCISAWDTKPMGRDLAILRLDAIQRIASRRKACCFRLDRYPKIFVTGASKL